MRVYPLMLAAAIPTLLAAVLFDRVRQRRWLLLLLAMLTVFSAKLISAMVRDPSLKLDFLSYAVMDKDATSYYVDAVALSNFPGWLAEFPSIMPHLHLHSMTKAPGSILYYLAFIKTLGDSPRTALIAGITIAVISTLSIPACYLFLRELKLDESAAFLGACFLSLCPGYILFVPASDPFYPVLSCLVGLFWIRAVSRESVACSIATGIMTAAILVVSFNVLVFGSFLIGYTLLISERPFRIAAKQAAIAVLSCGILVGMFYFLAGYDPIHTFESALTNQRALLAIHAGERPYPATAWNDLLDFALGSGWISYLLAGLAIATCVKRGTRDGRSRLVLLAIGQLLFVAIAALLPAETARVWNFMLPLLMIPVGMEVARQHRTGRIAILICLAAILAADCRNMSFVL